MPDTPMLATDASYEAPPIFRHDAAAIFVSMLLREAANAITLPRPPVAASYEELIALRAALSFVHTCCCHFHFR